MKCNRIAVATAGAVVTFVQLFAGNGFAAENDLTGTTPVESPESPTHGPRSPNSARARTLEQRAQSWYQQRAFPGQAIPGGALARGLGQSRPYDITPNLSFSHWYNLGPAPIGSFSGNYSGRVTTIAVDPSNTSHWLIGAAQGGIWETFNSGGTWVPRTDDQPSLAMGAIAFAPSDPSIVYAGTGEANFSGDSYAGQGLLLSLNGGTSWQMLNTNFAETSFSSIKVDRGNSNNLAVATSRGIGGRATVGATQPPTAPPRGVFLSSNGGTNFTQILVGEATALDIDRSHFNRQYAALGEIYGALTNGVYRTTNTWSTHELINGPWTASGSPTNFGRMAVAVSANGGTVYVGVSTYVSTIDYSGGSLLGIWESDNPWDPVPTWTDVSPFFTAGSELWYYFALSVDPNDPHTLVLGELGIQMYQGGLWQSIKPMSPVHGDQHAFAWVPGSGGASSLLAGNDGGLWRNTSYPPALNTWSNENANLSTAQMYRGAVSPVHNSALALAGLQDNGTVKYQGGLGWPSVLGNDGGDCAISSSVSANWALSYQSGPYEIAIFRTVYGYGSASEQSQGIISDPNTPFYVHFEKSPNNDDVFIAGTVQLWRCDFFFSELSPQWFSNSPVMLDSNGAPVTITAMAFAPSDPNSLTYAYGTYDGQLRMTTTGGSGVWANLDPAKSLPGRSITGLAFSPTTSSVLYVTLSGFDENTPGHPGHVFRTDNATAAAPAWVDVTPPVDLPHNCLAVSPANDQIVFVGTDVGTWSTPNAGVSWVHHGPSEGLPNVAVHDLRMDSVGQVTAFTHGRGAFVYRQIDLPILVIVLPLFPLDDPCGFCPQINWGNPGDHVTMQFGLQNTLPIDTVNLTATMLPSPQVMPLTGTQTYGALIGQGPPVSQPFSFQLLSAPGAGCGSTVPVTFQLQDGTNDLGQVTANFRLGSPSHPLLETFLEARTPALPPGWTSSASGNAVPWNTTSNPPPNTLPGGVPPDNVSDESTPPPGPSVSAWAPALAGGQSLLYSPPFSVAGNQAQLYFQHSFNFSNSVDGAILEISIGAQPFAEITQAGGSFAQYGYNGVVSNPLGSRAAWTGNSGGWVPALVNLPPSAAGQTVQLRWNLSVSRGLANGGWFISPVLLTEPLCLPPVTNPVIVNPMLQSNLFSFAIDTVTNRTYWIQFKTNLNDNAWEFLQSLAGNGARQSVSVPVQPAAQSFFRFQVQ